MGAYILLPGDGVPGLDLPSLGSHIALHEKNESKSR